MDRHKRIENAILKVIRLNNERRFKRGRVQGNITILLCDAINELESLRKYYPKKCPDPDPEKHEKGDLLLPCDCPPAEKLTGTGEEP